MKNILFKIKQFFIFIKYKLCHKTMSNKKLELSLEKAKFLLLQQMYEERDIDIAIFKKYNTLYNFIYSRGYIFKNTNNTELKHNSNEIILVKFIRNK